MALLSNLFMGDLEQGDVIVARKESFENGEPIVKRVIATEGQTVDIIYDGNGYGTVYVDGEPLDEPISWNRWCCPTTTARASL